MSRPRYPRSAFLRRMQMSRLALFVFIEGFHTDRYVYSKIIESECYRHGIDFKIVTANEIQLDSKGKGALIEFFDYLRQRNSLCDNFKGKTTISIFFLDKDVDDILGIKCNSEHVIYTDTYELENYLFIYGDLSEAAAASSTLEPRLIRTGLGDYQAWRLRAALKWKKWVQLCLFSRMYNIRSMCNYGRVTSPINDRAYGPVKRTECACHLSTLESKSRLTPTEFKRAFARCARLINKIYSSGQHDKLFKGKWYCCFINEDIRRIAGTRSCNLNYSNNAFLNNLAITLNFDDAWTEHFRVPTRRLLVKART